MKRFSLIILAGIVLLSACSQASGLQVSNAWARPALQDGTGAVYFLLQNHSASRDELTGVSSDAAQAAEMHESKMEGDVMRMLQIISLPIPGKASIEFGPGGYHVMLVGLKQDLQAGDEILVTLHFKNHESLVVSVPVQEMPPGDSAGNH
jgi:copper(I)-binding protein